MSEKRRRSRQIITGTVGLVWMDEAENYFRESGIWCDLSESGGGLLLKRAIKHGTLVRIDSPFLCKLAMALVSNCAPAGLGFRIGLEFVAGTKWQPKKAGAADGEQAGSAADS